MHTNLPDWVHTSNLQVIEAFILIGVAEKALAQAEAIKLQVMLEDLTVRHIEKVKQSRKGSRTYAYWMASWREGGKTRNVHLGSARKMDAEAARRKAWEGTNRALAADPKNPVALKNLGAILGREGDSLRALYYLRQSYQANLQDPQTVYGPGLRLYGAGEHRAGPETLPDGAGYASP